MAALADAVVQATLQVGLPWLEQHASPRALADFEGSLLGADVDMRVAAAVLLGDHARAQQILVQRRARFEQVGAEYLRNMRQWFGSLGLDVSVLPAQPAAPRTSAWEQQRQAAAHAEEAAHAQQARSQHEAAGAAPLAPAALAQAWVAEHRARWRQEPRPLLDLPAGCALADRDDTTREAALITRWRQELVTGGYPWGFAALVQWLAGPACTTRRAELRPRVTQWLEAYREFALAAHEQTTAYLEAERRKALDPAHALHEVLAEAREREAEVLARHPPPSAEELRHRIGSYPEQQMAGPDKQAVATLRRELRRDAATGRLPVAWDGDDWGRVAQAAWQAADPALRTALAPTLQRVAQGAWLRLPDVGARAPTAGGLVLRMLAGLGEAPRQALAARAQERAVPKQFKQAAERALKGPLGR